jgi:hypothetical protein
MASLIEGGGGVRPRDDRGDATGDPGSPGGAGGEGLFGGAADEDGVRPSERRPDREKVRHEVLAAEVIAQGVGSAAPGEVPGRLCAVAVKLLPVTGASVSLRTGGMPVQLSASSEQAAYVSEIQATLGDGPCMSAAHLGAPVLAADLTNGRDSRRWPVFAQQATAAGVQAVFSLPLGNDAVCVGTLDLYRDAPGELTVAEMRTAQLVASVMTLALMALPQGEDNGPGGDEPWLSGLATDHDEVYQAVGMIMVQLGVGADEALARLRAHAFAYNRTALETARDVVSHRKRFERD